MACPSCAGGVDADGYCEDCGLRTPDPWDHRELHGPDGAVGYTHKGRTHESNEDALAIGGTGGWTVGVVCDGVTSAPGSGRAARLACWAAQEAVIEAITAGATETALDNGWRAAQEAVAGLAADGSSPASTFCAAIAGPDGIQVAWSGDTRAYWLPDLGPALPLTADDHDELGRLTAWLGSDTATEGPSTGAFAPVSGGLLVLASDGFTRYTDDAEDVAAVAGLGDVPTRVGRMLAHAIDAGGLDDITVLAIPVGRNPA